MGAVIWYQDLLRFKHFPRSSDTSRCSVPPIVKSSICLANWAFILVGSTNKAIGILLRRTVLGEHSPENVVLTEVDPIHQKTFPDFHITAQKLGIPIIDIGRLQPIGDKLHYRNSAGKLIPIHRIYNRAIADELIAREIRLPFDLTHSWDVEWAGHPNWYFLISKFSIPLAFTPTGNQKLDSARGLSQ